jgi:hypothetical protein
MSKFSLNKHSKHLLLSIALKVNRLISIFPKDYFIMWDFNLNRPSELDFIPFKDYEMFYGADIYLNDLYCRYSNYISNNKKGILVFNLNQKKMVNHISLHDENVYFRLYKGRIIELRKYGNNFGLFPIDSDELILESKSSTFDIVESINNTYLIIDSLIYSIDEELKINLINDIINFINEFYIRDLSVAFDSIHNYYWGYGRIGNLDAYNTKLIQFKLNMDFELISKPKELSIDKYKKKLGIHGVGFPLVRFVNNKLVLYFSYFWGRHLLEFKTLKYWAKVRYSNR